MKKTYNFPVFGTQGGGLVQEVAPNLYKFVEKPDCPGLDVGDFMPKEWDIITANRQAREEVDNLVPTFSSIADMRFGRRPR